MADNFTALYSEDLDQRLRHIEQAISDFEGSPLFLAAATGDFSEVLSSTASTTSTTGAEFFNDLGDVSLNTLADGDLVVYNLAAGEWRNQQYTPGVLGIGMTSATAHRFEVREDVDATGDQRFYFTETSTIHSGLKGLHLQKLSTTTTAVGLTLEYDTGPLWDTIAIDSLTKDMVLAFDHSNSTDGIRISQATDSTTVAAGLATKFSFGQRGGSPAPNAEAFLFAGGDTTSSLGGARINFWSSGATRFALALINAHGTNRHCVINWNDRWYLGDDPNAAGTQLFFLRDQVAGANRLLVSSDGRFQIGGQVLAGSVASVSRASAATPALPTFFTVTSVADTALTASTEASEVVFNLAATRTFATGALTNQRAAKFLAPTYAFAGASTLTNAATLYIDNAPAAGSNATITNAYALWVDDGLARFEGRVTSPDTGFTLTERFGALASVSGNAATAVGNASSAGLVCTAVGWTATAATNQSATAVGAAATASGFGAVAVGSGANAAGGATFGSTAVGNSASATGGACVVIGKGATDNAGDNATAVGYGASSRAGCVAIGTNSSILLGTSIAIGNGAAATSQDIVIGQSATAAGSAVAIGGPATAGNASIAFGTNSNANASSIAFGSGAVTTAASQILLGGTVFTSAIDAYLGKAITHATPLGVTIQPTGGSGSNIAAGNLTLAGGKATGNAAGGDILFSTSDTGSSGTTLQTLREKWRIVNNTGEWRASLLSSTTNREVFSILPSYVVSTDASRTARAVLAVTDFNAERECIRLECNGSAGMIGFLGAAAVVRPGSTTDLRQALIDLGLYTTGGATPLDLNGGALTAAAGTFSGTATFNGAIAVNVDSSFADGVDIAVGTTTGTKIGTATTQKLGFWNAAPVVRPAAYTPTNVTTDRSYDADATTLDELADVVGTLLADLQSIGLIG